MKCISEGNFIARTALSWTILCALMAGTLIIGPNNAFSANPGDIITVAGDGTFGFAGDLAGRRSIYPARMFTLPVTTQALAGWPMLFGTAAMASLWLVTALFVRWSWGLDLPLIWPALLGAVFLAWTQVLTWTAYGLPGLRIVVAAGQ